MFGGKGKLTGVLWALVLVATMRNVLGLKQIGGDAQGTIIGLLLIGSLLVSNDDAAHARAPALARSLPNARGPGFGDPAGADHITEAEDATPMEDEP